MKKLFHAHPDIVIAALATALVAMVISFYSWAINDIYTDVHQALTASTGGGADSFDLAGAAKLDLRGIAPGVSVPAAPAPQAAAAPTDAASSLKK